MPVATARRSLWHRLILISSSRSAQKVEIQDFTSTGLKMTISGGITEYTGEQSATLIERSKSLLIHARESERNRFCLDGDILTPG